MLLACALGHASKADEASNSSTLSELKKLSLEELANIEVTSAGKKPERLSAVPVAMHVITQEDIHRSGATTIADALRLAPGLEVARVDSHNWAISARGFNGLFANKLLVLIDGRSVYTPLFSGVFWYVQDTLLADIDRIEVIRGPGATLWGANAVNGVINIITKSADETQGTLLAGGGGSFERGLGEFRYGGRIGEKTAYRLFGKYFDRDDLQLPSGASAEDRWNMLRGGFRLDSSISPQNHLTLQGEVYDGETDGLINLATLQGPPYTQVVRNRVSLTGGHVLGRWGHSFSGDSHLDLQLFYDRTTRRTPEFQEDRDTYDADLQHRFALGERQEIVWGTGYRATLDDIPGSFTLSVRPTDRTTQLWSSFIQDEVVVLRDRLRVTVGSKFEYNSYTGFEVQPSARFLWTPAEKHSLWASLARAVRTPSRSESDLLGNTRILPGALPGFPPTLIALTGNPDLDSEKLLAYELGYRVRALERVSFDQALFYNDYARLRSFETRPLDLSTLPSHITLPVIAGNSFYGETYGAESGVNLQAAAWWKWRGAYTFLQMQLHRRAGSFDVTTEADEGGSPHHQISLQSSMDLPGHLNLDLTGRFVDRLPAMNVPSYFNLDARLAWKPRPNWELAVVGQNLLESTRLEFGPSGLTGDNVALIERAVYGVLTVRF